MKLFDLYQSSGNDENRVLRECVDYLSQNGGAAISPGRYEVGGDGIYLNISEYNTRRKEESSWEAHRDYVDFQIVLEGEEYIHVSDLRTMELGVYVPERDFLPCDGAVEQTFHMIPGKGLLLLPEDAHMPGVSVGEEGSSVKKAVFKIPITLN